IHIASPASVWVAACGAAASTAAAPLSASVTAAATRRIDGIGFPCWPASHRNRHRRPGRAAVHVPGPGDGRGVPTVAGGWRSALAFAARHDVGVAREVAAGGALECDVEAELAAAARGIGFEADGDGPDFLQLDRLRRAGTAVA